MRFIIGNMDGKALGLNANELCVLEAIAKCSRGESAKGWYGSMLALAETLPFIIDHNTVGRCVKRLLEKGLVVRREDRSLVISQNEISESQNEIVISQNETETSQNEIVSTPPYNPPIIDNNDNNNLTETTPCVPATENVGEIFMEYTFDIFIQAFHPTWPMRADRKADLRYKWEHEYSRAKKKFIMDDLFAHEAANTLTDLRDPFTYCEKFKVPAPYDYNGHEIPAGTQVFSAAYNGVWGMYTQKDIDDYNLELPKQ